jgi:hypothetical protein
MADDALFNRVDGLVFVRSVNYDKPCGRQWLL